MTTIANKYSLDSKAVDEITSKLSIYLADHAVLYFKTLNFHWNMIGPHFFVYHRLLEEQYTDLALSLDELAEHIRSFDRFAPGSMEEFLKLANLKEAKNNLSEVEMVKELIGSHKHMAKQCQELIEFCEREPGTVDFLTQRLKFHEKASWLLKSHFK